MVACGHCPYLPQIDSAIPVRSSFTIDEARTDDNAESSGDMWSDVAKSVFIE